MYCLSVYCYSYIDILWRCYYTIAYERCYRTVATHMPANSFAHRIQRAEVFCVDLYFAARENTPIGAQRLHSNHWRCGSPHGTFVRANAKRPTLCGAISVRKRNEALLHVHWIVIGWLSYLVGGGEEKKKRRADMFVIVFNSCDSFAVV